MSEFKKKRVTDRQTNRPMDWRTHLKTLLNKAVYTASVAPSRPKKITGYHPTDGRTLI